VISDEYFAGLFDGEGSVSLSFRRERRYRRSYSTGFSVRVVLSIGLKCSDGSAVVLEDIRDKYGGYVYPKGRYIIWETACFDVVKSIIEVLADICVIKREQLRTIRDVVIPMFENKEHLTRGGLVKLARIQKTLNNGRGVTRDWESIMKEYWRYRIVGA